VSISSVGADPCQQSTSDLWQVSDNWRRGELLGQGSYGSVYKAFDARASRFFAVKQTSLDESSEEGRSHLRSLKAEIDICVSLQHRHIVSYLGHAEVGNNLCIFLEYVAGGSLARVLQEFGPLEGKALTKTARGCAKGLSYLHSRSPPVVHRDIKCANILVDLQFCAKLADFGCSKNCEMTQSFTTVGSIPWMAPEVIMQKNGHGRKADIWSLGCTVLEMATAERPWGKGAFDNPINALRRIGMSDDLPPIPTTLPEHVIDFLLLCLNREASARPSSRELLRTRLVAKA